MKKSHDKDDFIRKPEYPGGREAMKKFLSENLKYPKAALKNKIEGKVYLSFKVDHDGKVKDIQVLKSLGYGCDEEAVRVIGLLHFSPQKNRGSRVSIQRKMKINFKLPPKKTPQKSTKRTMKYTYTQSADRKTKPPEESQSKPARKYTYTVTIKPKNKK